MSSRRGAATKHPRPPQLHHRYPRVPSFPRPSLHPAGASRSVSGYLPASRRRAAPATERRARVHALLLRVDAGVATPVASRVPGGRPDRSTGRASTPRYRHGRRIQLMVERAVWLIASPSASRAAAGADGALPRAMTTAVSVSPLLCILAHFASFWSTWPRGVIDAVNDLGGVVPGDPPMHAWARGARLTNSVIGECAHAPKLARVTYRHLRPIALHRPPLFILFASRPPPFFLPTDTTRLRAFNSILQSRGRSAWSAWAR